MPTAFVAARSDPLRNFKFTVQIMHPRIPELATLGFMAISGLQVSTEQIAYREGGFNTFTRKMPGQSDFPPVVCSRGMFVGNARLWQWFRQIFYLGSGTPDHETASASPFGEFRASVRIRVLPHPTADSTTNFTSGGGADPVKSDANFAVAAYQLYQAWPLSMSFSDMDAGGNGIIMEQLTLAHEGMKFAIAPPGGYVNEAGF